MPVAMIGCGDRLDSGSIRVAQLLANTDQHPERTKQAHWGARLALQSSPTSDRRVVLLQPEGARDGKAARALATRLVGINQIAAATGGTDSIIVDGAVSVATTARIPLVSATGPAERQVGSFQFSCGLAPGRRTEILADYAAKTFAGQQVVVLINAAEGDGSTATLAATTFAESCQRQGGPRINERRFRTIAELRQEVDRSAGDPPAAIFLAGTHEDLREAAVFLERKPCPILFGGDDGTLEALARQASAAPIVFVTAFVASESAASEFVNRFEKEYARKPTVDSALAFDSTAFLLEGIRAAPRIDGAVIRDELAKITRLNGSTGEMVWSEKGWPERIAYRVQWVQGKIERIDTIPPKAAETKKGTS